MHSTGNVADVGLVSSLMICARRFSSSYRNIVPWRLAGVCEAIPAPRLPTGIIITVAFGRLGVWGRTTPYGPRSPCEVAYRTLEPAGQSDN